MSFWSKSLPAPNDAQKRRFEAIKRIGCICCLIRSNASVACEIHHLVSGNKRRGHEFSIGCCEWHHRGVCYGGSKRATELLGPSLANGSKPFHAAFGSDDELLDYQNNLLGAHKA